MLARPNRLTRGADYRAVVRRGVRCAGPYSVTYVVRADEARPPRFGFIVSKQVGNAVVRNTIRRRMKALCFDELAHVAPGSDIVIRALPRAAGATSAELGRDIRRCLLRSAA